MEIFPDFKPLSLKDRSLVDSFLRREQPVISEMTFANMYMWRMTEPVEVASMGNSLIFRGRRGEEVIYSPPVGADDKVQITKTLIEHSLEEGVPFLMKGVVEPLTSKLRREGFKLVPDRDNWDYVYLTSDLAELPGPRFHSKRKEIKKFQSRYEHKYTKITPSIIPACIKVQEQWRRARNCQDSPSLMEENHTVLEALRDFDKLGLFGGAVVVDGEIIAFAIGEMLNRETWVTHFEKATPGITGLYQYINQQLALEVLQKSKFINREQDLGERGLRIAKTSYHPHHMVEKSLLRVDK
jgi:hypothetical protein